MHHLHDLCGDFAALLSVVLPLDEPVQLYINQKPNDDMTLGRLIELRLTRYWGSAFSVVGTRRHHQQEVWTALIIDASVNSIVVDLAAWSGSKWQYQDNTRWPCINTRKIESFVSVVEYMRAFIDKVECFTVYPFDVGARNFDPIERREIRWITAFI
jgi:hypothetical protein